MKKIIIILTIALIPVITVAQTTSPTNPPGSPEAGTPLGGGAPIDGGLGILLMLGAAYGGKKSYALYQKKSKKRENE